MAATAPAPFVKPPNASFTVDHKPEAPKVTSIKTIAESANLKSIPSQYACTTNPFEVADPNDPQFSVPVIDYSFLTSSSPEQRSKTVLLLITLSSSFLFFSFLMSTSLCFFNLFSLHHCQSIRLELVISSILLCCHYKANTWAKLLSPCCINGEPFCLCVCQLLMAHQKR